MIRESILAVCLILPFAVSAAEPVPSMAPASTKDTPAVPVAPAALHASVAPSPPPLPPMDFLSSVGSDEIYALFKAIPAFSSLDNELVGSPLTLMVTHTSRPTAGGQAAGLLSGVLSGSTLGIIPIVSNEHLVIRYEVLLNGKILTSYSFEKSSTRAINLWAGAGAYAGLGKGAFEGVKSPPTEAPAKLAVDPAQIAARDEIDFYFPGQAADRADPSKP